MNLITRLLPPVVAIILCSCGGDSLRSQSHDPAEAGPTAGLLPSLDALPPRTASVSGSALEGAEYSISLPSQGATPQVSSCLLSASGSTAEQIAYAIYDFSLPDYSGPGELQLELAEGQDGVLLGFSHYGSGRWIFRQTDALATQTVEFGSPGELISESDRFLVAVLAVGDVEVQVDRLTIGTPPGGNIPPLAVLNVDNIFGEAPFTVNYDASGSSDADGSITLYELDLDNDDTYEISQATPPMDSFEVSAEGSYPLRLRVTDDGGASAVADVVVTAGAGWQDSGASINTDTYVVGRVDFDADGAPLILHSGNDFGLGYTRALDADGVNWPAGPTSIDSNGYLEDLFIAEIGGRPAVAYTMDIDEGSPKDYELRFVLAQNAAGTSWAAPVVLPETEFMQEVVGLAVVAGNPAVIFRQFVTGEDSGDRLYYSRATDSLGSSWSSPVKVSELIVTIEEQSNLFVFGGVPCVVLAHNPSGTPEKELRLARAADAQGSSWLADELVLETDIFTDCPPAVMELGGKLAIAYLDFSNVYIVRSTDGTATSWGAPETIATTVFSFHLAFHDSFGHPALSWSSLTPHTIAEAKYIRALDSTGMSWPASASVITSSTENVSSFSYSMVEAGTLGGLPAAFTSRPGDPLKLSLLQ